MYSPFWAIFFLFVLVHIVVTDQKKRAICVMPCTEFLSKLTILHKDYLMNHIYRSIWNEALGTWVAVSEIASGQGKRAKNRRNKTMTASPSKDWQSYLATTFLLLASTTAYALPTGNELIAGQATVATPNANTMQINQASQNAVINWQGFSVGQNQAVNIQQPNAQAALLNRVVGQDASQIQGQINANGQVYLVNPNGVLFSKTAQVDVAGLVATTHDITNANFMAGTNHFTQNGATGTVQNDGTINAKNGGVVALIGTSVTNNGTINTPNGTAALAAGKTVDLDFQGNGLVEVKVSEAALNAQITNNGAVIADGGRVMMTAQAAGQLIDTVINQQGVVKAQGMSSRNGEIILDGGSSGTVQISGTVDASNTNATGGNATGGNATGGNVTVTGQTVNVQSGAIITASGDTGGGTVTIGDKQTTSQTTIENGATVSTQAQNSGNAGTINVYANTRNGTVNVAGKLDASAPTSGNGGKIDTSAANVKVADSANITTKANNGNKGTWLIDPFDFTIAATGGNITGTALSAALNSGTVTITAGNTSTSCTGATCTAGSSGVGDINVNDAISWSANNALILNAWNNININANITGSGTNSSLTLQYGQSSATPTTANYFINNGANISLPAGQTFSTQNGSTTTPTSYTVITSAGATGSTTGKDLQGMNGNLQGNYALGANIDASAIANFTPIMGAKGYSGNFAGLGHTISNLTINLPNNANNVGLFGQTSTTSTIRDVGLIADSVSTGTNAMFTCIGGLVGINNGTISNAYATGNVSTDSNSSGLPSRSIGGLVGHNSGNISNAYATGNVSAGSDPSSNSVGGLVGINNGTISNAYATGSVSGLNSNSIGGLLGSNSGTINASFWNITTTGQNTGGA